MTGLQSKDEFINRTKDYAESGYLCSEAVLLATSDLLEIRSEIIPAIASGFGAGMGRHGTVCGAITGGIIGLGLRFGRKEKPSGEDRDAKSVYWYSAELLSRFRERHGTILCSEITNCNLMEPDGLKKYREENLWKTTCRDVIASVSELVHEILVSRSGHL